MKPLRIVDPPAIVQEVADLAELANRINAEHEAGEGATRRGLEHFCAAGDYLIKAKAQCKHEKKKWMPWLKTHIKGVSQTQANVYMRVAKNREKLTAAVNLRDALRLLTDDVPDDPEEEEEPLPEYVTIDQWADLPQELRKKLLATKGDKKFNSQGDNENIEWALWSWNPVTGCEHNCPYCYARDIATSGPTANAFPNGFAPTFIPSRLSAPQNTTFPEAKASEWMGHKNVFTCSMADLFGRWVPKEWVDAVLASVRAAPQWNFLFLTKFPIRMAEFDFPENAWVGTSVDCQARVKNAEKAFRKVKAGVKWLSCEPLIEPLHFADIGAFNWIVLGGASSSSQTPEWHPPRAWVAAIEDEAVKAGVAFYEKSNLFGPRLKGYPGHPMTEPTEAPPELQYLPKVL